MGKPSKRAHKSDASKKQASAKQAFKKNTHTKKGKNKSQNAQLLDLLDQQTLTTIQEASTVSSTFNAILCCGGLMNLCLLQSWGNFPSQLISRLSP
jgi:S-methylmethionine-dependent homocysteine/selenocysteine methylase